MFEVLIEHGLAKNKYCNINCITEIRSKVSDRNSDKGFFFDPFNRVREALLIKLRSQI